MEAEQERRRRQVRSPLCSNRTAYTLAAISFSARCQAIIVEEKQRLRQADRQMNVDRLLRKRDWEVRFHLRARHESGMSGVRVAWNERNFVSLPTLAAYPHSGRGGSYW